jgi:hypothetical protein
VWMLEGRGYERLVAAEGTMSDGGRHGLHQREQSESVCSVQNNVSSLKNACGGCVL